jgi:hypothetical protein
MALARGGIVLIAVAGGLLSRLLGKTLPEGFWRVTAFAFLSSIALPVLAAWFIDGHPLPFVSAFVLLATGGCLLEGGGQLRRLRRKVRRSGHDQRWYAEIPAHWRKQ